MHKLSVVIITKNEAHIIEQTILSVLSVTDDIVIVDSGSTDDTVLIAKKHGANVIETTWDGYGKNKNKGIAAAKHNWILNLDADEVIDEQLQSAIKNLPLINEDEIFEMRFKNFYLNKWIKYGEWGNDKHIRLFNRNKIIWNAAAVHENLTISSQTKKTLLNGSILHYTVNNKEEYLFKTTNYAMLNAKKYFAQGKQPTLFKLLFSPLFSFVQNYIIRLGFLDGKEGFVIAKTTALYTFLKYKYLNALHKNQAH